MPPRRRKPRRRLETRFDPERAMNRAGCGEDIAPYLLGALDAADAERFERHLAGCELCRTDLERLRPAARALPPTAEPVEPPPALKKRVMAEVERDAARRRQADRVSAQGPHAAWWRRPLPVLAAACVVLLVGVGVGTALTGEDALTVDGKAPPGATAQLEVRGDDGTLRVSGMADAPAGRVYQVWLMREGSSTPEPTDALFDVDRDGTATVDVPGDMEHVDRVLVSDEPRGGSRAPTTQPGIAIEMS
jgi:anti-sigma-K factor RskA